MKRMRGQRGGSALEFAFILLAWTPLVAGTVVIGSRFVQSLQTTQLARDAGHMYGRGVDFYLTGPQKTLSQLASELGTLTSDGTGVVIFSRITYVGSNTCAQAGLAANSNSCPNYQKYVFTQQYVVGNRSLRQSSFGKPTIGVDSTTGVISLADSVKKSGNRSSFSLIPNPKEDGTDGYQAGNPIYVVEVYFPSPALFGFARSGTYAYAVF